MYTTRAEFPGKNVYIVFMSMFGMHSLRFIACLIMLVLAGCGGFLPTSDESTGSVTTPAGSDGVMIAPGLTDSDIVNVSALVRAHRRSLTSTSVTVERRKRVIASNGTVVSDTRTTARYFPNRTRYTTIRYLKGAPKNITPRIDRIDIWDNGVTQTVRLKSNERTIYITDPRWSGTVLRDDLQRLPTLLGRVTRLVATPVSGGEKPARYRIRSTELLPSDHSPKRIVRNTTLAAVIDDRGFIHEYSVERVGRHNTTIRSVNYTAIGTTTIERPTWVQNATGGRHQRV